MLRWHELIAGQLQGQEKRPSNSSWNSWRVAESPGVGAVPCPRWGPGTAPGQPAGSGLGDAQPGVKLSLSLSLPLSLRKERSWLWGELVALSGVQCLSSHGMGGGTWLVLSQALSRALPRAQGRQWCTSSRCHWRTCTTAPRGSCPCRRTSSAASVEVSEGLQGLGAAPAPPAPLSDPLFPLAQAAGCGRVPRGGAPSATARAWRFASTSWGPT